MRLSIKSLNSEALRGRIRARMDCSRTDTAGNMTVERIMMTGTGKVRMNEAARRHVWAKRPIACGARWTLDDLNAVRSLMTACEQ